MPLGKDIKYRVKHNPDGSMVRLAFRGDTAIEAKPLGHEGGGDEGDAHMIPKKKSPPRRRRPH